MNYAEGSLGGNVARKTYLIDMIEWARQGGLKSPFLEQVNVRLGTGLAVLGVMDDLDLVQTFKGSHDYGEGNASGSEPGKEGVVFVRLIV